MLSCPYCGRHGFEEAARLLFRREPKQGDLFCCTCAAVVIVKDGQLTDPTAEEILEMTPAAYALLWRARRQAAECMRHTQGGRV